MSLPRILILGKNGQVGWELRRTLAPLGELTCLGRPEIDLAEASSICKCVRRIAPAVILNAAAYTAVDQAESEPDRCQRINGVAPGVLAEEANQLGAWLVHYSTDYVFDGKKNAPYSETDAPNPLGAYACSKLAGERAVQQVAGRYLIFRLCWVYSARGQNFMRTIMRLARERETLRVVRDQVGCPTWARMIAETSALALQQVLAAGEPGAFTGVYHLAASGQTTWHGFAEAILKLMPKEERKCQVIEPITTAEYPTPARRPAYSVLSCEKLKDKFELRLPDWEESLNAVLEGT